MRTSTKGRFAVNALIDLALREEKHSQQEVVTTAPKRAQKDKRVSTR